MKKHILLPIQIFISGILLIYLFTIIPYSEILQSLKSARIILVVIGLILSAMIEFFSAVKTQYLTKIQGMTLSVFEIMKIHLATSFYSLFLPGILSGGVIKWYKFSQKGSNFTAASVVVFNRFLEIFFIVFIGLFFLFATPFNSYDHKLAVVWLLACLLMATIYLILFNKQILDFTEKIILNFLLPKFIIIKADKFMTAIKQFQNLHLKHHFEIIGLLFLYHGIGIIFFYCFAKSLNIDIDFWVIGWVRSAISISVMIPLSFAGLGIREGLLVFLLGQYGVSPNDAMALSFFIFSRNLLFSLIGGLVEFKDLAFSKKLRN